MMIGVALRVIQRRNITRAQKLVYKLARGSSLTSSSSFLMVFLTIDALLQLKTI